MISYPSAVPAAANGGGTAVLNLQDVDDVALAQIPEL